jgi:tRNA(Arg) A34 adenosine deaminase TadA
MESHPRVQVLNVSAIDAEELKRHESRMRLAIGQARRNPDHPFGAVLVDRHTGVVVAEACNAVENSPLLHGETAVIDGLARRQAGVRWRDLTLYTTAEPCPMCAAAIAWTGIGEVVFGTRIETIAGLDVPQILLACADVLRAAPFYRGRLVIGVAADLTDQLYRDWAAKRAVGRRKHSS